MENRKNRESADSNIAFVSERNSEEKSALEADAKMAFEEKYHSISRGEISDEVLLLKPIYC